MDIPTMLKIHSQRNDANNTESPCSFDTAGWILNLVVVLPENIYVIWLIVSGAGNGVASEFFSLNLSICEILLCLQSLLSLLSSTFPNVDVVVEFLAGVPITGRPLFQCLICIECYLAVVHPFAFLKFKPLRYRMICSSSIWLLIIINCVFAIVSVIPNRFYFFICISLCQSVLALIGKLFCCLAALRALKQSGPGERGKDKAKENLVKRRAFYTLVMILMATIIIYAAHLVAAFIYVVTNKFVYAIWTTGHVCFSLAGLVQPLLYLQKNGKLPFCRFS